jgi:hypothetical protein
MTDEKRPDRPDPLEDVRKGLGLLFRAAQSTVASIPTDKLEKVITTGAEEVKRAFANVSHAIEREVRGDKAASAAPPPTATEAPKPDETQGTEAAGGTAADAQVRIAPDDQAPLP